jgi:2-oxoisovalerate dehydrogenase E2 component (dihydrolipoyl transacylase)
MAFSILWWNNYMKIFKLPDLGEGLPDAEIHQWYVTEGDTVAIDQPLVAMETAKAIVDVPAPYSGKIGKLYGKVGDIINTSSPLVGFVDTADQSSTEIESTRDSGTVVGFIEAGDTVLVESPAGIRVERNPTTAIKAIPAVRALANKLNVNLHNLQGSGPGGTITREDVNKAAVLTKDLPVGEILHGTRRAMAQQMAKSHAEVVPVTIIEDADIHLWPQNTDISIRVIRAILSACATYPIFNAHFYGDSLSLKICPEVNLGIAVNTDNGLFVPVIKDAPNQSDASLRATLNRFKEQAASNAFVPEDLKNPTIILSNFGTIAGRYSSPIVVPPMVAILATGKIRPAVVAQNGVAVVHPIMPISLTFDHRAITGAEAAHFLAVLLASLEQ